MGKTDSPDWRTLPAERSVHYSLPALALISRCHGKRKVFMHNRITLGSDPSNDFVLDGATVSRFHAEIRRLGDGWLVRDVGSTNGVLLQGVQVREAYLFPGARLDFGGQELEVAQVDELVSVSASGRSSLGELVGRSDRMRLIYGFIEQVAPTDATVLVTGETGTGKEVVARTLHARSKRKELPLVVVDCAALPPALIEAELFGHEKGSFSGAIAGRKGLFERADNSTLFLDEVGELPLDLQPRLLRVLESGEVRRVGANDSRRVDFRLVAATNRDLEKEVEAGRFRKDLYHRLDVVPIRLPPLRERQEDIPALVEQVLATAGFNRDENGRPKLARLDEPSLRALQSYAFPGNVRELVHLLERRVALGVPLDPATFSHHQGQLPAAAGGGGSSFPLAPRPLGGGARGDAAGGGGSSFPLPFSTAKDAAIAEFERSYLADLLEACDRNLSEAARRSGVDRKHLRTLLRKHGLHE